MSSLPLTINGAIAVVSLTPPASQLINPALLNQTNFVVTTTGSVPNGPFRVLTQTNPAVPLTTWTILSANTYDTAGSRVFTNFVNPIEPERFFIIVEP